MDKNQTFDNKSIYKKLKHYFENNVKLSLKTKENLFIITKSDIFYEIDIYDEKILSNDNSIIESMSVEELCKKKVIDLKYGLYHYIARTSDGKNYYWGFREYRHSDVSQRNKPELNEYLSDLNIVDIKCGAFHTLALTSSGEVFGLGKTGQSFWTSETPKELRDFGDEKIVMISCGYYHSMALTNKGRVFFWSYNSSDDLEVEALFQSKTPKLIKLNDILIAKISCGKNHSLLLTRDGVIYAFRDNIYGQIRYEIEGKQLILKKLKCEKRFIDIASHWKENISIALSFDGIYYVWDNCGEENILISNETKFKSFNEIFNNYFGYSFEVDVELLEFNDLVFRNGYYEKNFEKIGELGSGSFARVYKVLSKVNNKFYAIKQIYFKNEMRRKIFRQLKNIPLITSLKNYVARHYESWLEISSKSDEIFLYIKTELCDTTLQQVIDEIDRDPHMKIKEALTPIGYYIASQISIELLEGVGYLHRNKILHRDLNPFNILLKKDEVNRISIKIIDFYLMTIHEFDQQLHTKDIGNIKYMAPEVESTGMYDTKADIFSLGTILNHLFKIYLTW
jgi:alpha-tubulin suppressor-like RCC1 family protein